MIDRLTIRQRPPGSPLMYQTWGKLLFLHWQVPPASIRPLVPSRLQIDTHDGAAWVGVTPFTMWNIRPAFLPPLPVVSTSHELNVRTYVHLDGVPGVWFFSLDASNPLAVLGARLFFGLPYYDAKMTLQQEGETFRFSSRRTHTGAAAASFDASWSGGDPLPQAAAGSLEFFLTERYCLYTVKGGRLYRSLIHHRPWPLRRAKLHALSSIMLEANGLAGHLVPLLLHQREPLEVEIWPLKKV